MCDSPHALRSSLLTLDAGQAGRWVPPLEALRAILHLQHKHCINVTHGLKSTPLAEAGNTRNRSKSSATPFIGFDQSLSGQSGVDFEGFCGAGKPRENLWANSEPDQNNAVFLA